jgi:anti-sigma regulatory factor (Ser/Thr protein kinase)
MTGASVSRDGFWLAVPELAAAGGVRRAAVALGQATGLDDVGLADLAIVATEIATNLARHAVDGTILVRVRRHRDVAGVELVAIDRGPGMSDVTESLRDGNSTAGTLGIGLGAITRKATEFDVYSQPGSGTALAATVWNTPVGDPAVPTPWVAGVSRPMAGEQACGDSYASREIAGRHQVLVCDGLGHGPLAGVAAQATVAGFLAAPAEGPKALLDRLHAAIQHTRGVVVGVAELGDGRVCFAGVGNISATIVDAHQRRAMVSFPGILGHRRREIRELEYPLPVGALVVLHSDGLTEKWELSAYPGLVHRSPVVIAATLLRDAGRRRDDAAVLVAKAQ